MIKCAHVIYYTEAKHEGEKDKDKEQFEDLKRVIKIMGYRAKTTDPPNEMIKYIVCIHCSYI